MNSISSYTSFLTQRKTSLLWIGYLPIQKQEANLLFQLLAMRYEHRSTIITTNIVLSRWGELFQSPEIAAAILDRLVHHVKVFKITGKSYRMRNKV